MADPAATSGSISISGACYATFAYDIGFSIDLDRAQSLLASGVHRETIKHHRRAPTYFQFRPAPLGVRQTVAPIAVCESHRTDEEVDCIVHDFGAVAVTYRIPLGGTLGSLLALSDAIYDHAALLADSRRRVERLLQTILPAVTSPMVTDLVEDFAVFQIEAFDPSVPGPEALLARAGPLLAQILRAETGPLSEQETADALSARISFGPDDLSLIDYNSAVLLFPGGDGAADVRDVLEFANVELLEMRFLDDRLDAAMDGAYKALSHDSILARLSLGSDATGLGRIARLQADGALLFEAVNNALKLVGDQYLARVYRLAAHRLHLPEWDSSILRKLQTVESIYQKLADRQSNRRMELLEWIIILLIAMEIVMALVPGLRR